MLKGKKLLKFPQKSHHSFPNGLGSLVAGFDAHGDGGEDENGVVYKELESGEELETFEPFGLGSHGDVDDHQNEGTSYVKSDAGFSEIRAPPIHKVDVEAIDADDKRSDLDYEVRRRSLLYSIFFIRPTQFSFSFKIGNSLEDKIFLQGVDFF